MSFGFPASHTEDWISTAETIAELQEAILDVLDELGWSVEQQSRTRITAKTSINWLSWGEKIDIQLFPDLMLTIRSSCALPTQCFDWGKNRDNVRRFLATLQDFLDDKDD